MNEMSKKPNGALLYLRWVRWMDVMAVLRLTMCGWMDVMAGLKITVDG